jgi:hypothetical protein
MVQGACVANSVLTVAGFQLSTAPGAPRNVLAFLKSTAGAVVMSQFAPAGMT